jgi:COMPASS component SWD2
MIKMQNEANETESTQSKTGALASELEETKQKLEGAKEEANFLAQCIKSLKKELEQTKKELEETKAREMKLLQQCAIPETTEDIKFIANATNMEIKTQTNDDEDNKETIDKRRYVKFASPHVLAQVIPNKDELLVRPNSIKKGKKKTMMPLIGWLFSKKKGSLEVDSPKA